ncbi:MAG: [acyl-carrier-protein] S-malonyltransferase [Balneolaceae bacterium]|nr:MAG: [acyl-carrier-protein] S-malonyltransferase [Balneolaceae bacterium]
MKAVLFPGQGSQKVGMGLVHYESEKKFRDIVESANELLGYSISEIMFEGPLEKLTQTRFTQPAIFVHSVALYSTLDLSPDYVAGHSLGEFSALTAAGVIGFEEALSLVSLRGELMQDAGVQQPGAMAALIGMDDERVDEICKEAEKSTGKPVVAANYNCPGQLVISGDVDAVKIALEMAKSSGCRIAKLLPVSGAFHSPLMQPAYERFKENLNEVEFTKAKFPVYSNYTALPSDEPEVLRENILRQLVSPVKWTQIIRNMSDQGVNEYIEVGPGNVLQGLVKRTLNHPEISGYE